MDINICIEEMRLNANTYKLNQSVPPHGIIEWQGKDKQPSQKDLESAWNVYLIKQDVVLKKQNAESLKLAGVKFEGVMCSAEAEDMWSLSSIKDFIQAGNSTKFVFKNGNTLTLTPDNLAAFQAVWIPFRLGFFK